MANALNLTANGTGAIPFASANKPQLELKGVTINKVGATGNILVLRHGSSAGAVIATIDTTALRYLPFWCVRCPDGLYYDLNTGTAADVTIVWE